MSPRQLDEWPKEKNHEFHSVQQNDSMYSNKGFYIAVYCKCQTSCIGIARNQADVEEIQWDHLKLFGEE